MNESTADLAISHIVDREDRPEDWDTLAACASAEADVWHELLATLRADAQLRASLVAPLAAAARVALPVAAAPRRPRRHFGGWIAAAVLAMAWGVTAWVGADAEPTARVAASGGDFVGELKRVVVEARPARDGHGYEVLYLRRLFERAVVPEMYELAADEHGVPMPVAVSRASLTRPVSY